MGLGDVLPRLGRLIRDTPSVADAPGGPPILSVVRPVVRPVLGAVVLLVPLAFAPGWDEVFAPAKFALLWLLIGAAVAGGVLAVLVRVARTGELPGRAAPADRRLRVADLAVAGFLGWTGVALALSTDPASGIRGAFPEYQGVAALLAYAAVYGMARVAVRRSADLDRLLAALTVATGLIGAYAILQRLGLDPVWREVAPRPFATVGQANSLAAVLVLGVPAAGGLVIRPDLGKLWRAAALIAGGLGLVALLLTLSRGGWLALLVQAAIALALLPAVHRRRAVAAAGAVLLAGGVLALTGPGRDLAAPALDRVTALGDPGAGSAGVHRDLLRVGVAIAADHPLTGAGPETYPDLAPDYARRVLDPDDAHRLNEKRSESPHDVPVAIAAGTGLPGLAAYLVLVGAVLTVLVRNRRARWGAVLLVAAAGHLVTDLFMTAEVTSTVLFWVLLGAAGGLSSRRPQDARPGSAAVLAPLR